VYIPGTSKVFIIQLIITTRCSRELVPLDLSGKIFGKYDFQQNAEKIGGKIVAERLELTALCMEKIEIL